MSINAITKQIGLLGQRIWLKCLQGRIKMIASSLIIYLIIILELSVSSLIFLFIGLRTFQGWQKSREEILIHFSLFSIVLVLVIVIFSIYVYLGLSNITIQNSVIVISVGFLYDLFYLEISIIYLAVFTNSRYYFEIYFPFIIGISAVFNLYFELSETIPSTIIVSTIFHMIAFLSGVLLIFFGVFHLKKSKSYFTKQDDIQFVDYLIKILVVLPFLLFSDALGFLFYLNTAYTSIKFDELLLFIFSNILIIVSVLILFFANNIASRAKKIDLTAFLNTIS